LKVAVSATGNGPESQVDQRFGRARWFIVFDTESDGYEALDNTSAADAASGAGIATAQVVIDAGAQTVLTGACGPKASNALRQGGVKIVEGVAGTAKDAFERFTKGEL
jgi:predicted Fe-Mo cluster-binding NifX family protein